MKKYLVMLIMFALLIPNVVFAEEEFVEVATEIKYYKTITYYDNNSSTYSTNSESNIRSYTVEVTEEEYNNYEDVASPQASTTVTTDYKKMAASLLSNGSKYRYRVMLDWKTKPATRSYDIIGIGHLSTVKLSGNLNFTQDYCLSGGGCACGTAFTGTKTSTGSTATFKLPSGTLTALTETFYFDVEKNASTVTKQEMYADYSHATKTITQANALKHTVGGDGINLNNSIVGYYDAINYAYVPWSGTW